MTESESESESDANRAKLLAAARAKSQDVDLQWHDRTFWAGFADGLIAGDTPGAIAKWLTGTFGITPSPEPEPEPEPVPPFSGSFNDGRSYERAVVLARIDDLLDELLQDDAGELFGYNHSTTDTVRHIRGLVDPTSRYAPVIKLRRCHNREPEDQNL